MYIKSGLANESGCDITIIFVNNFFDINKNQFSIFYMKVEKFEY